MIEKIIKAVKSNNKKRSRNITIGAVIGFLLSCTAVAGVEDKYLWIKKDGEIKFNTTATIDADGSWSEENPYEEIIWNADTQTYTNNMTLSSSEANGKGTYDGKEVNISYGLRLSGDLAGVNFINNGSVIGIISGSGYGYGIYNSGKIGDITNRGIISSHSYSSGSGIYNSGKMGNIINTGVISGSGYGPGYGIYNDSGKVGNIINRGIISGFSYGIYNDSGKMGNITNRGIISSSSYGIYNNSDTMGNITNGGIIRGRGSGIQNYKSDVNSEIKNIRNTGIISGSDSGSGSGIGNAGTMRNIRNTGVISGYGYVYAFGYGIENYKVIDIITNTGVISGYGNSSGSGIYNKSNADSEIKNITNGGIIRSSGSGIGYGIYNSSGTMGDITNTGVLYGKDNAIMNYSGTIGTEKGTSNNYGILVNGSNNDVISGLDIATSAGQNKLVNYGLIIKNGNTITRVKNPENIEVSFYNETLKRKMEIKNAELKKVDQNNSQVNDQVEVGEGTKSFELKDGTNDYNNSILNGQDETLKATGSNNKVTGSIINAYGTAVVFEGANKQLTLSGTIVNGGIDNSDPDTKGLAISGSGNGDTLILQSGTVEYTDGSKGIQNTIVNGNIDMGGGADTLIIGAGTILNGTLDGGADSDTLNFGISSGARSNSSDSQEIKIMHNISNFENMNINTNVTLFEKTINASGEVENLKVTGAEKITIEENGTLTLRIDSTNKDNSSGKIIGHALSGNKGEISSNGGKLLLALNGAGNESTISFGSTTLGNGLVTGNGGTLDTTSALHTLELINNKEVKVIARQNIPGFSEIPEYEKLNKIYQGILSVKDLIGNFNVDNNDEKLSIFLGYLKDIYAGNPYSYSSELSRKSVGMFRDIATENQFKPKLNNWLIMGGLTHVDGGTKDTYYGKGYYTYDIGSSDMDADTKITGAYMLGEYGVSDTLTYGVVIGGNKLKSNLSNGSKVDGDALYMGAYAKKYVGNLKVTAGLGLQYGDYDADRLAVNKVASSLAEPVMKYSDNYNDMTYDIYLNGRYSNPMGDNFFLEPYGTLSYTYVDQDGADEGNKVLAIETDSKSFDYTAAKVGVDLKKVIPHEKGKSTLSAGVSYTRFLNGADEENITGRFKGGSDFDILVAHKNEHSIGLNAKYTLELESGILFDVKGSYSVERDSHNRSGKNRNKGEWVVGTGLGYKF